MIIDNNLKNIYKVFINDILSNSGLTVLCTLYFDNNINYCSNCIFDKSNNLSSNVYNNTGPVPFDDYTMCPVCMGSGKMMLSSINKELYLAIISDSKYFINMNTKLVNIPDGYIQIITYKNNAQDLKSCSYLTINSNPNTKYERVDDINLVGLGDLDYIIMNWRRV